MKKQKQDFYMRKDIKDLIEREKNPIWRRIFAYVIDILIIQIIVEIIFYKKIRDILPKGLDFSESYKVIVSNSELNSLFFTVGITAGILTLLYFTLLEFKYGQSIGKMLFKIKVNSDIKQIKLWQPFLRNIPKSAFFINYLSVIFIIDLFFLIFTKKRLFEKLSKTHVSKI